jgi:hypothetical protein
VLRGAGNVVATFSGHTHRVQTLTLARTHAGHLLPSTIKPSAAAYLCVRARCVLAWRRRGRGVNVFCREWGRTREAFPG